VALGSGEDGCHADHIALRHGNRVCLKGIRAVRGKVEDPLRASNGECTLHVVATGDVTLDAVHVLEAVEAPRVRGRLQDRENLVPIDNKAMHQIRADEPGGAGHETADDSPSSLTG